jgi:hypothetical protein
MGIVNVPVRKRQDRRNHVHARVIKNEMKPNVSEIRCVTKCRGVNKSK